MVPHLERPEYAGGGLEDAVDAVGHVEAVGPVVVGHRPVVLLHGDEEPHLPHHTDLQIFNHKHLQYQERCCGALQPP